MVGRDVSEAFARAGVMRFGAVRPHDLLRVDPQLASAWPAPAWVRESLERAPWVVVRRAHGSVCGIAIGVRGFTRDQRFAATIAPDDVRACRTPYDLVALVGSSGGPLERTARALALAARASRVRFGPTGSYGFELASGRAATHRSSDLDGIVAAGRSDLSELACESDASTRARLGTFAAACERVRAATGVRIDLEVQLRAHGVALAEYLSDADPMLAKTSAGPALVAR
ncbi:MAG: malonate decarboxylase holo-ACP synthase [Vulcanimicrobiaceae bacterium]